MFEKLFSENALTYMRILKEYLPGKRLDLITEVKRGVLPQSVKTGMRDEEVKEVLGIPRTVAEKVFTEPIAGDLLGVSIRAGECKKQLLDVVFENSKYVELDYDVYPLLNRSTRLVKAVEAWNLGFTGKGVSVGVLDTGVDWEHPSLRVEKWKSFDPLDYDTNGHGTHIAGIIASKDPEHTGVSPEVKLYAAKVIGVERPKDKTILEGYQWLLEQGCDIINMSFGRPVYTPPERNPFKKVLADGRERGVVNVAAAGNEGPYLYTINNPGYLEECLTVGATETVIDPITFDVSLKLADFSSRGPTRDGRVKPDIIAPGSPIVSCGSKYSGREKFQIQGGTSQATAHVSGAAAILFQSCREEGILPTPERIEYALKASAEPLPNPKQFDQISGGFEPIPLTPLEQGWGFLNIEEALKKLREDPKPLQLMVPNIEAYVSAGPPQFLTPYALAQLSVVLKRYRMSSVGEIAQNCMEAYRRGAGAEALKLANATTLRSNILSELGKIIEAEKKLPQWLRNISVEKNAKSVMAEVEKAVFNQKNRSRLKT
ncbi:hypothetical protein DRO58_01205 [Candidatus Bathyarchaeota archaeon]|nr:MAG: hypothetical protein DRO58_01205 [Candidatus Bathyarchaeota archaeon]